jgi:hypothetical protein
MEKNAEVLYAYKVDHDLGINPNPFGGYCTLAYCKGTMRDSIQKYVKQKRANKNPDLSVRDMGIWVIGIAGKRLGEERCGKLLYAMQVTEVLTFKEYWDDSRFEYKIRVLNKRENIEIKNDRKDNYAFFKKNKNWQVCGDRIFGIFDKKDDDGNRHVLVSDTFIYHGYECHKQNDRFILRFASKINDPIRPYRIFSDNKKVAKKPIPQEVTSYIRNEFNNNKCLSRPAFSAEGFDYSYQVCLTVPERKDGDENYPLSKRVRHC